MSRETPTFDRREFLAGASAVTVMGSATVFSNLSATPPQNSAVEAPLQNAFLTNLFAHPTINERDKTATLRFFVPEDSEKFPFTLLSVLSTYPEKDTLLSTQKTEEVTVSKSLFEEETSEEMVLLEESPNLKLEASYFPNLDEDAPGNIFFNLEVGFADVSTSPTSGPFVMSFYLQSEANTFRLTETKSFDFTGEDFRMPVQKYTANDKKTKRFKRTEKPGEYNLQFVLNPYKPFEISVAKSDYESVREESERWTPSIYRDQTTNKYARYIGKLAQKRAEKYDEAENVRTKDDKPSFSLVKSSLKKKRFEFARRFVQTLPYKKDIKNNNRYHYPQYIEETLVRGCGDCEDFAILMASIFEQPPFNYTTALIFLPTHIGVGIKVDELPFSHIEDDGVITIEGEEFAFLDTTSSSRVGQTGEWDLDNVLYTYTNSQWGHINAFSIVKATVETAKKLINLFG
jgi:hypothetical protein